MGASAKTITANNNTLTVGGIISGTSTLIKNGAGALTLSGANAYSGTTLNAGILNINNSNALGAVAGTFVINGGTIDNTSGAPITTVNYPQTWNSSFAFTGSNNLNLGTGAATLVGSAKTITANGSTLTVGGVIGGAFTLIKSGAGALTLSGVNAFSGTTLNAGTLNINNSSALGSVAGSFTINGGTINNTSGAPITTLNYPQDWNSDFTFTGTQDLNMGTGAVDLNSDRIVTTNANTLTVGGVVNGVGARLTKNGAGTLVLSGSNVFTGGVTINAGILRVANAGALNTATPNTLTFGASSTGRLQLNGFDVTISGLNTDPTPGTPIIENGVAGTNTLTVNSTLLNTFAGVLQNGAAGTLALTKNGTGSLALRGNNTYSGTTILSAGTLNINSATAIGSGAFTINSGTIDNTSGGALTLSNNNAQNWNGDFTFTGTNSLNLGTGTVTMPVSRQITVNANTLTVGSVISAGSFNLTKAGNGTLSFGTNPLL